MLRNPEIRSVVTHWGTYEVDSTDELRLKGIAADSDPSEIGQNMVEALTVPSRILRPAVRASFLQSGGTCGGTGRGSEPFVEVDWDTALDLAARHLDRIRTDHGNQAIYGGSYGWGSAGRFHHAQSQIHRFLNCIGGYTRSVQNYSYAAADVILPHVLGENHQSGLARQTTWREIAQHTEELVLFGGAPRKNSQVSPGGIRDHSVIASLKACKASGMRATSISPIQDDTPVLDTDWWAIRPGTDVALMLGLAHCLVSRGRENREFLARCTVGYERFRSYLLGETDGIAKTSTWASGITGLPASDIEALAVRMAERRTFIMMSWSLQRAEHGEQPYWMAITLACILGQIGLQGGGVGFGYGSVNGIGTGVPSISWPSLSQGANGVDEYIPVARVADMLLEPGGSYDYDGQKRTFPDIRAIYWAGGNPFHHHQDLNRLAQAWEKPELVIVNESWWNATARRADIVFPVTTQLERDDIAASSRDLFLSPSHAVTERTGEVMDDYDIFTELAARMNVKEKFTEGRTAEEWIRHLYLVARQRLAEKDIDAPDFETFWAGKPVVLDEADLPPNLARFRDDPERAPLRTPSGKIEIFSETIDAFGYDDCPGHATWMEPSEWLGSPVTTDFPLHMMSNQPSKKLHSQYDCGPVSRAAQPNDREPIRINPIDAAARDISTGDIVRVFNSRGSCLASAVVSDSIRPGVVQQSTGAWFDPTDPSSPSSLEKHGNPNVLTHDRGTSKLARGPAVNSCLVEVEKFRGKVPELTCFSPPAFVPAR